jgi:glucose dehydrogenase
LGFADDVLQPTVQTLFLTATDSEFIAMDAASTVHHWRARSDAIKVCADLRVCDWVSHLNNSNGIAPSSAQIYDRFCLEVNKLT